MQALHARSRLFMASLTGQVLLSSSCSGFACGFNCVQTCLCIVTPVASGCGPVVSSWTRKRLGSPPREEPPRTSHHWADVGPYIIEW
jgi:hypothetical protein